MPTALCHLPTYFFPPQKTRPPGFNETKTFCFYDFPQEGSGRVMGRRTALNIVGALVLCAAAAVSATAQDFQKTYELVAGGSVKIANVSGDVNLTGYEGSAV